MSDSSVDFLHPNNVCGRTLLTLVARGSAIVAELLRLSQHIPSFFTSESKYSVLLHDFRYLKSPELYDQKIDRDVELTELDEEFRENQMALLERFYRLFESIYRFFADYMTYLEELHEGVFVQHTIENVLEDREGGQLLCEALYLYGVMLLLLDMRIDGQVREKIIISYYRYKGHGTVHNFEEVVKLCRQTGFAAGKRPPNYPEEFFARVRYPVEVVLLLIARLRADDLYNHTSAYPSPQHRSIAYAAQSSMMYILLYFVPELLHRKDAIMREIVDKCFPDNWVLPFYMGYTVDLSEAWTPYKAAVGALRNIMSKQTVEGEVKKHSQALTQLNADLDRLLMEGVLTSEFVLSNPRKLMEQVRNCNYTLRWLMLHRTTVHRPYRELVQKAVSVQELMRLMMHTAQFEFVLKEKLKALLDGKARVWEDCKKETKDRLLELSTYYSGAKELTRVKRVDSLVKWFKQLADEVESLDFGNSVLVGRKMTTLISALEEVTEFETIDQNLQVKQFLAEIREYLKKMVKTVNINVKIIGDLDIISDFAYAWDIINDYTPLLHDKIKNDPLTCLLLRATFLKLASILNLPLIRISQANSPDDVSVADKFSSDLVQYVRGVLEIIPQSVFVLLDKIIDLQTNKLKPIPTKMERKFLSDYAQLDLRFSLARFTHEISVFTQGILAIKTTIMGVVKVNPKQLLEDGIRKELVIKNATFLHDFLQFKHPGDIGEFERRLGELGKKLDGFRLSFEFIQDYLEIYGLKIWQEELSRIINYNVQQECNSFLKKKIYDWQSQYQSDAIPIPQFAPIVPDKAAVARAGFSLASQLSVNFMGRLTRELINLTDVRKTVYVESMQGWYEKDNTELPAPSSKKKGSAAHSEVDDESEHKEIVGIRTFSLLMRSIGIFGLTGMDRLISFMLVKELQDFVRLYRKIIIVNKSVENYTLRLANELHPLTQFPMNAQKLYENAMIKTNKLWPVLLESIVRIGQFQLIRRQIANELNFSCKLDSKLLSDVLDVFNQALIKDLQAHYSKPEVYTNFPGKNTTILSDVSVYLETSGMNNPLTKIYITTQPLDHLPLIVFLFTLANLQHLQYNAKRATLENNRQSKVPVLIDGAPLIIGVITLLKQFHSVHLHTYLGYLGQYVRAQVSGGGAAGGTGGGSGGGGKGAAAAGGACPDVQLVLIFLEEFVKFSHIHREAIEAMLPSYIFDRSTQPSDISPSK